MPPHPKKIAVDAAQAALRRLPVLVDAIVARPLLEKTFSELGVVPQRCGLCRHFNLEAGQKGLRSAGSFSMVMEWRDPTQVGAPAPEPIGGSIASDLRAFGDAPEEPLEQLDVPATGDPLPPPMPINENTRLLRPGLVDDWPDYGACTARKFIVWAYDERPPHTRDEGGTGGPCPFWA